MNRKIVQTESLLTRIQNQLFEGKKDSLFQKEQDKTKQPKAPAKKKTYGGAFSSAQLKSRSSEKPAQKSDSYENLFSKKSEQALSKKAQRSDQLPEKLHESFSHHPVEQHSEQKHATKSLYFTEFQGTNESTKDGAQKNMKIFDYYQKYSELLNRCNPKQSSASKEPEGQAKADKLKELGLIPSQFEQFKIEDINSLIDLIDSCVQEANAYIRDLSIKVEVMQEEINELRKANKRMDEFNKVHLSIIKEKDEIIQRLTAERNKKQTSSKNEDIKNLLKMIEQLNEQNGSLREELDALKLKNAQPSDSDKKGKEIYNQIHRKIEILNISVNDKSTKQEQQKSLEGDSIKGTLQDSGERDSFNATNSRTSQGSKKYKFIRPKG